MQEVEHAFEAFIAAFNALDLARFRACLAADVSLFPPRSDAPRLIEGAAAVGAHFAAVFCAEAPAGPAIRPTNVRVTRLDERAALVTFEFPRPHGSIGRRTLAFRLEGEDWKIAHVHASNTEGG